MSSVSVIIPCYNYAHLVGQCVESVLSQQGVDVRVLIIDDCSSDDSPQVGASLAADSRVTFRRHEQNRGHIATFNEGIAWAEGDYLVLLSADDLLTWGALARAATVLDEQPEVGLVYGHSLYFLSNDSLPPARTDHARPHRYRGPEWIARRCRTATNCISSPEVVVRTSLQHKIGGYRSDLPHAGDIEMWLRFAAHSDVVYLRGVDQAFYRKHPQSMMRTTFSGALVDLEQRKAAFDAVFELDGVAFADSSSMHDAANRALAREALWACCRAFDRREIEAVPVDELLEFARSTYPKIESLPEYMGLRWRRRIGERWSHRLEPFLVSRATHRARDWIWWRRRRLTGV